MVLVDFKAAYDLACRNILIKKLLNMNVTTISLTPTKKRLSVQSEEFFKNIQNETTRSVLSNLPKIIQNKTTLSVLHNLSKIIQKETTRSV